MKHVFAALLSGLALVVSAPLFSDSGAIGTWKTEANGEGYLHVAVEVCNEELCGTIVMAFNGENVANENYEHIGKRMIWGMKLKSANSWGDGKIWDPSGDKTYKSKMSVSGNTLNVSGCVLMFCRAQQWTRVN